MKSRNKRHVQRVQKLIIGCSLCAIILTVSTYAWFIGMKTVNVSSFDVKIAAIDSLSLSLNGSTWSDTVDISEETYSTNSYEGNTNSWGDGLIPMSSVGKIDPESSRMILFEKGSMTTTPGGYRLMASQVKNTVAGATEQKGYVAFDLFIKNLSGNAYYQDLNKLNEEAIYLTVDSEVSVSENGGEPNTGIENSVRVAFAQIGRVRATTGNNENATLKAQEITNITNIGCADVAEGDGQVQVTGMCRNAQIWEPNDTSHVQNAINWYNTSCKTRSGSKTNEAASYTSTNCATVNTTNPEGTTTPTYAISRVLGINDYVDVYDGDRYNTYTTNTDSYKNYLTATDGLSGEALIAAKNNYKLIEYPYFTDTMKNKIGTSRPTFMTLAPNSITKLRVYIYIEGQDIDNYDFASLGKKISVNFGFTKERYTATDVDYVGPELATPGE